MVSSPSPFVIFLDIDGVLNGAQEKVTKKKLTFKPNPNYTKLKENFKYSPNFGLAITSYFFNKEALINLNKEPLQLNPGACCTIL